MEDDGVLEQFRTHEDLRVVVDKLIKEHRDAKNNKLGVMFRVVVPPNETTTYEEGHQGPYVLVKGVRVGDYKFKESTNLETVIADRTCGLSFSKNFSHLKSTQKMLARHANGYNQPGPANVSWWILSEYKPPQGLEFVKDPKESSHYFLAAVEEMHVDQLVSKLKSVANHMAIMKDAMS